MTEWTLVLQIVGIGFLTVFVVLLALATVIWIVGIGLSKVGTKKDEIDS